MKIVHILCLSGPLDPSLQVVSTTAVASCSTTARTPHEVIWTLKPSESDQDQGRRRLCGHLRDADDVDHMRAMSVTAYRATRLVWQSRVVTSARTEGNPVSSGSEANTNPTVDVMLSPLVLSCSHALYGFGRVGRIEVVPAQ